MHDRPGLVPAPPARLVETPHEIHVLTDAQAGVDHADLPHCVRAAHERGLAVVCATHDQVLIELADRTLQLAE